MSTSSASSVSVSEAELSKIFVARDFAAGFFEILLATTSTSSVSVAELSSSLSTRDFAAGFFAAGFFEVRLLFERVRVLDEPFALVFGRDDEEAGSVGAAPT